MHWLWAVALGLTYIGAYLLGLWLARRGGRAPYVALAACFVLVAVRVVFYYFPEIEYGLSVIYAYTLVQAWWSPVAAFVLLGIGTLKMTQRWRAILVGFCAWLLFVILVQSITARVLFDPSECVGEPGWYGLCPQTTDFTCGAAGASTLLAQYQVPSDEREMALLCWTNYHKGTQRFHICKALHQKLGGASYRPRLMVADWETLAESTPAMVTINITKGLDHWVVVLNTSPGRALIADPDGGVYIMSKAEFVRQWQGFLITVEDRRGTRQTRGCNPLS